MLQLGIQTDLLFQFAFRLQAFLRVEIENDEIKFKMKMKGWKNCL